MLCFLFKPASDSFSAPGYWWRLLLLDASPWCSISQPMHTCAPTSCGVMQDGGTCWTDEQPFFPQQKKKKQKTFPWSDSGLYSFSKTSQAGKHYAERRADRGSVRTCMLGILMSNMWFFLSLLRPVFDSQEDGIELKLEALLLWAALRLQPARSPDKLIIATALPWHQDTGALLRWGVQSAWQEGRRGSRPPPNRRIHQNHRIIASQCLHPSDQDCVCRTGLATFEKQIKGWKISDWEAVLCTVDPATDSWALGFWCLHQK